MDNIKQSWQKTSFGAVFINPLTDLGFLRVRRSMKTDDVCLKKQKC